MKYLAECKLESSGGDFLVNVNTKQILPHRAYTGWSGDGREIVVIPDTINVEGEIEGIKYKFYRVFEYPSMVFVSKDQLKGTVLKLMV